MTTFLILFVTYCIASGFRQHDAKKLEKLGIKLPAKRRRKSTSR